MFFPITERRESARRRIEEKFSQFGWGEDGWPRKIDGYLRRLSPRAVEGLVALIEAQDLPSNPDHAKQRYFLRFLRILLPDLKHAAPSEGKEKSLTEGWLESYAALERASTGAAQDYFRYWQKKFFLKPDPEWALRKIELFLLSAKFAPTLRAPEFVNGAWVERESGKAVRIECVDDFDPSRIRQFLDAAKGNQRQAPHEGVKVFEYRFVGREIPKDLFDGLVTIHDRYPLSLHLQTTWSEESVLVFEDLFPALSRKATRLGELSDSPAFASKLRKTLASVAAPFKNWELKRAWKLWLEHVAEKRPLLLKALGGLQDKLYAQHPTPTSILDFLLENERYFERITGLSTQALQALEKILLWEDLRSIQRFFGVFFGGGFSLRLQEALENYTALKALGVFQVDESLAKSLGELERLGGTGNIYGWLFSARKILKSAASPQPWLRAAIEPSLGPVTYYSSVNDKVLTWSLTADFILEYEDRDVIVEYKALLNFSERPSFEQEDFFRQAEKYAAYLRKAAREKNRPQVMEYYFYGSLDSRVRARLKRIFSGLNLKIYTVDSRRVELETLVYSAQARSRA